MPGIAGYQPFDVLGYHCCCGCGSFCYFQQRHCLLGYGSVLAEICLTRWLNPVPFLLGLACAANIGSVATLIGNPQNMLIGQTDGVVQAQF